MKSTGIVRKIDHLGRIVLPIELRRVLDIDRDSPVEIYVDGDSIILKKQRLGCIFCNSLEDVKSYKGRNICAECRKNIGTLENAEE